MTYNLQDYKQIAKDELKRIRFYSKLDDDNKWTKWRVKAFNKNSIKIECEGLRYTRKFDTKLVKTKDSIQLEVWERYDVGGDSKIGTHTVESNGFLSEYDEGIEEAIKLSINDMYFYTEDYK